MNVGKQGHPLSVPYNILENEMSIHTYILAGALTVPVEWEGTCDLEQIQDRLARDTTADVSLLTLS